VSFLTLNKKQFKIKEYGDSNEGQAFIFICVFNKLKGEEINLFLICVFALRKLDT